MCMHAIQPVWQVNLQFGIESSKIIHYSNYRLTYDVAM